MFLEINVRKGLTANDRLSLITININEIVHYRVKYKKFLEIRFTSTVLLFNFENPIHAQNACEELSNAIFDSKDNPLPLESVCFENCSGARIFEHGDWTDL